MGLRNIIVTAKEYTLEDLRKIREKSLGLSLRDLKILLEVTPNLKRGVGLKQIKTYQVLAGNTKVAARVVAVAPTYFSMGNLRLVDATYFDERDESAYEQVCVLGSQAKEQLFGLDNPLGKPLKIHNTWFPAIGITADQTLLGQGLEGVRLQNTSNDIYVPLSTALKKLELEPLESELDEITFEVNDEENCQRTALLLYQMLERLHNG